MSTRQVFFHGGKAGLDSGELLVPSPPHVSDGCPVCVARASGMVLRVGEYRRWAQSMGPAGARLVEMLEGAPDDAPVDPPSAERAVYITTDREYARWYAARSRGDLYRVAPVGAADLSSEDRFPTWTVAAARVVEVIERSVILDRRDRRSILRRWKKADKAAERAAEVLAP